jgi:hypothetical protein
VDRDVTTRRLVPVFFVRPAEWYLLAAVLWLAACGLLAFRRRVAAAMVTGAAIVAVGVGVLELRAYQRPVAFAVRDDVRLREAPYGPAAGDRVLAAGQAAIVERAAPPWLLVRRGGARGWVLLGDVARL